MEEIWIPLLVLGYALGACLMLAFWSRIPPSLFFEEVVFAVLWPVFLLIMVPSAFIDSLVRALRDRDGTVGGLWKDGEWVKKRKQEPR